eukprot:GHVP01049970.1.p1 GENE.GHVP01049970.1~~GHVP01049970.1.p1  ORF type:complete len:330 (+),score=45.47 GHVP01049970.1:15-1004(+)
MSETNENTENTSIVKNVIEPSIAIGSLKTNTTLDQCSEEIVSFETILPEKDMISWKISEFESFRTAATVSNIPALTSPEFGRGCRMKLWPNDKGHVSAKFDVPSTKLSRPGLLQFLVSAIRFENQETRVITSRGVDLKISGNKAVDCPFIRLSRKDFLKAPKYQHLLQNEKLNLQISMKYFPFESPIFRGPALSTSPALSFYTLLRDIEDYCKEDRSQNIHIRCGAEVFPACRFLLAARSKKFLEIMKTTDCSKSRSSKVPLVVKDVTPDVFEQILQYIHTDTCEWIEDPTTTVQQYINLFSAGTSYEIKVRFKYKTSKIRASFTKLAK